MDVKSKGKLLSLILRHKPAQFNIKLDDSGFAELNDLVENTKISLKDIEYIVHTNAKKRFEIVGSKIRAVQGHSIPTVDLGLSPIQPPDVLYHGTSHNFLMSIKKLGIKKMARNYVHLSANIDTAITVAKRRDTRVVVLHIDTIGMHLDGNLFYYSNNGVWMVKHVPYRYVFKNTEMVV